jgi:peptide/nickel transport system substrate-binding protein
MKLKLSLAVLLILSILLTTCGGTPEVQTVVETVVVEKEGETIIQTVEVEKEVIVTQEVEVEKEVVVTQEVEVVSESEALRRATVIFDLDRFLADDANANPYSPGGVSGFRLAGGHQVLWEPFFILNPISGEIVPWLATSFESNEAGDVWTLSIREGVKWSDGEDFDADDVIFTVEMLKNDETSTLFYSSDMQRWVDSVEKVDDLTVVFNLTEPNPRFQLDYFSVRINDSLMVMPEHIWAGQDPLTFTNFDPAQGWPVGTGPYTLSDLQVDRIVWDRNDDWWGAQAGFRDLPEPLRVIYLSISNEDTRVQRVANNEIDAGQNVSPAAFEAVQARNPNVIAWFDGFPYSFTDVCVRQLDFNTTVSPWDSAAMRKAVNLIIDREEIAEFAYDGTTTPATTMFLSYGAMQPFNDAIADAGLELSPTADVAAAQALIEGEGYTLNADGFYEKDGEVLTVNITVNSASTEYTRTVDVIVEQLREAGIDAAARPVDNSTFWGDVAPTGGYEIAYSWLACGSINEPWASMDRYTAQYVVPIGERAPGFNNTGRWNTENTAAYSAIVEQIAPLSLGDPAIPGLVAEAYAYLMEDMPFIPLVQSTKLLPFNTTYWTGWPTSDDPYIKPGFWSGSAHLIIHNLVPTQ